MVQRRVLQCGLCLNKKKCLKPDLKCVNRWSSDHLNQFIQSAVGVCGQSWIVNHIVVNQCLLTNFEGGLFDASTNQLPNKFHGMCNFKIKRSK